MRKAAHRSAIVGASMVASVAMASDPDAAGRAKLAEMMAFVRDGPDQCGEAAVPTGWGFEVLALYMGAGKKAPPEEEIAAKQDELAAMKSKMGVAKWCALYRLEMEEADMLVKLLPRLRPTTEEPQASPRAGRDCSGIPKEKRTLDCAPL
jgi:hypothetical protein